MKGMISESKGQRGIAPRPIEKLCGLLTPSDSHRIT